MFGFLAPSSSPKVAKAPASPPPAPEPVVEKKKAPSKGLFSFSSSAPTPPKVAATAKTAPVKKTSTLDSAPASMNAAFQQSISKKLKNDRRKIQTFQKATDAYRAGSSKPEKFLEEIEALFGVVELESIIGPLSSELPEADKSKILKSTYQKLYKQSSSGGGGGGGGLFGGLFGGGKSSGTSEKKAAPSTPKKTVSTQKQAPTPAPVARKSPAAKKSVPVAKTITPAGKAATFNKIKVPAIIPAGKQVVVGQRIQSFQGGSLNVRDFYNFLIKTLGKPTTDAAIPGICATLSSAKSKELQNYAGGSKK